MLLFPINLLFGPQRIIGHFYGIRFNGYIIVFARQLVRHFCRTGRTAGIGMIVGIKSYGHGNFAVSQTQAKHPDHIGSISIHIYSI